MKPLLLSLMLASAIGMSAATAADTLNVKDNPFATPSATPAPAVAPQVVYVQTAAVTPESFEATGVKWVGALAAILGTITVVLIPAVATLWTKLHDVIKRQDRQAEKTGSLQEQVTSIAAASPPPVATAPAPSILTKAPLIALALLLAGSLGACDSQTLADARKGFLKSTDVSISGSFDGVTVSDTITNGRRKLGVNVDAKQIARLQRK